jgi:lipoate-protein ligase A
MPDVLRVIDFGQVTPLRSQTCWHAVAYGVSAGAPPTLSFARPSDPYVCLGYHRDLSEVDLGYCAAHGLPVYRRMVGGGPVYCDEGQLFFQICLPAALVPASRVEALRVLLSPAVEAFRAAGVRAELDADGEIVCGEAKICGHGAGQIEDAVVVCGNLIENFDHARATRVLALDGDEQRRQTLDLMRRYVTATPADANTFKSAMAAAYARALGRPAEPGHLTRREGTAMAELDARFTSPRWLAGPGRSPRPGARQVKVRAGVWTFAATHGRSAVVASVVGGRVERAHLSTPGPNGRAAAAAAALSGVTLTTVPDVLAAFGAPGAELAAAFATADGKRIA